MTKPSSLSKRMSENAEPLTEGAQSQTASVLAALIEQHCHLSLGICTYGIFQNLAHGLRAKNGKNLTLKNREKMSLNARRGFLESYILRREAFSAGKNEKAMPSVTGQVDLHFVGRISPAKKDEK